MNEITEKYILLRTSEVDYVESTLKDIFECNLKLDNGFIITGEISRRCKEDDHKKVSFQNAISKAKEYFGIVLAERAFNTKHIDELIKIQKENINKDYDEGLTNGLILARSVINDNETPDYI